MEWYQVRYHRTHVYEQNPLHVGIVDFQPADEDEECIGSAAHHKCWKVNVIRSLPFRKYERSVNFERNGIRHTVELQQYGMPQFMYQRNENHDRWKSEYETELNRISHPDCVEPSNKKWHIPAEEQLKEFEKFHDTYPVQARAENVVSSAKEEQHLYYRIFYIFLNQEHGNSSILQKWQYHLLLE